MGLACFEYNLDFERRYTNIVRDSLGIKRDFFKRKKEVAICDNMLIYSKDQQGVDMEDKDFKKYISRAISNSKSGDKAFYDEGKKSTRVVFLKKCECVKEPCKFSQNRIIFDLSSN